MKRLIPFVAGLLVGLGGCGGDASSSSVSVDANSATIRIFKSEDSSTKGRYLSPLDVELRHTYDSLSGILANNENVCPSVGDVNLLVIPVHLPGCTYNTPEVRNDIERTFFGGAGNGFVSLSEFYRRSSYGKLNFGGFVTDWFDVEEHTSISSLGDVTPGSGGTIISEILRKAVDWAFETYEIDKKDYDKNGDGSLDGVWMVYDHHNYFTQMALDYSQGITPSQEDISEAFWNFTSWDYATEPNKENPTTSGFSWASFDQMYLGYAEYDDAEVPLFDDYLTYELDSHTYIHETGHLLGLEDYYTSSGYAPCGSSTMMERNVGDLDSYSKMLLGWVTPYVVYGSSEIRIDGSKDNDHSVIVIPSDYEQISDAVEASIAAGTIDEFTYSFNPFSEYLLIDMYTCDGLDELDNQKTIYGRQATMNDAGVRIYHVDGRIFKCRVVNHDGGQSFYYEEDPEWDGGEIASDEAIFMPISNDRTESSTFQLDESYDYLEQIRLLESGGTNTFDLGRYAESSSTLWNEQSEPFDILTYGYQFFGGKYTFNEGQELPFKVKVLDMEVAE